MSMKPGVTVSPVASITRTASEGFSGSEIEAAIVGGLYRAFAAKTEVTTQTILEELAGTSPLSETRAEDVEALRVWARERAVPADGVRR